MIREWRDFLDDMLGHALQGLAFVQDMPWEVYNSDIKTQYATARAIEIIGEAARHIPQHVQQEFPAIPWRQIIGMRNILAHNYDGADPRILYDTAQRFLPELIANLRAIIESLDVSDQ